MIKLVICGFLAGYHLGQEFEGKCDALNQTFVAEDIGAASTSDNSI